jgi:DNA-binding FadR family transcriptional regulator
MKDTPRDPQPQGSRAERIAEAMQVEIAEQRLETGARLGLRTDLIARFGASPSAMDEALRLLRARGLITVRPGPSGGVFVEGAPAQVRLGAIDVWFSTSVRDPRDLFAARSFFDDAFAALAVTRAAPEDVRAMSWALDEMRSHRDDPRGYLEASMRLHHAVARASGISVAVGLYETVVALLRAGMVRAVFVEPAQERVTHSLEIHEGMIRAIEDGDIDAMHKLVALHSGDLRRVDD